MIEIKLHPKQSYALNSPCTEALWGGSAGGGKSFFIRASAVIYSVEIPGLQTYIFRRKYKDLTRNHLQGSGSFNELLRPLIDQKLCKINTSDMVIDFANGSRINLCHMQHEHNMYDYQGAEIHYCEFDELTTFTEDMYTFVRSRLRLGGLKIPDKYQEMFPRAIGCTNPGNIGHNFFKENFVDYGDVIWRTPDMQGGMLRQFISAKLEDNPTLTESDPHYAAKLLGIGDPVVARAMLEGSWDITGGGALDDLWSPISHVVEPFLFSGMNTELYGNLGTVNKEAFFFSKAYDYGSSAPYGVMFFATLKEDLTIDWVGVSDGKGDVSRTFKKGSVFVIDEIYGADDHDKGLYETVPQIAEKIHQKQKKWGDPFLNAVADASIFDIYNGNSIANEFSLPPNNIHWKPSDKRKGSRVNGLSRIRTLLRNGLQTPMEEPGLFFFSSCVQSVRTIPTLPRDPKNMEDVDTSANDHLYDVLRYHLYDKLMLAGQRRISGC